MGVVLECTPSDVKVVNVTGVFEHEVEEERAHTTERFAAEGHEATAVELGQVLILAYLDSVPLMSQKARCTDDPAPLLAVADTASHRDVERRARFRRRQR